MKVTCWGTRGSIATPGPETARYGGNTTCLEVLLSDNTRIIFDAGTGIRKLGNTLMKQGNPVDTHLFMTHAHWDHVQGFPFFAPAYIPGNRLRIYGHSGGKQRIKETIIDQMESIHFPVNFNAMQADITFHDINGRTIKVGDAGITCMEINHPGGGVGYRIEDNGSVLIFVPDNDLTLSESDPVFTGFTEFCRGADLLFHDSQFTPEQYDKFPTWGHSNYIRAVHLALASGVSKLGLFHHDPGHDDNLIDSMVYNGRSIIRDAGMKIECFGATELSTIEL